ncbi:hypothetical protein [Sandaracinus amylolyticus]|uniref:hypothetical protein n=1 Tax=Sandaracinus amylolyticus TaxID=927083 RepID=UPI001F2DE26A|nr:hypothetical protein [Sandaracinus amylolyticus]UJR81886.1 Hypothetical protein I5071_39510 [Sandaracinus amylolyticus]
MRKKWVVASACAAWATVAPSASAQVEEETIIEERVVEQPVVVEERVIVEEEAPPVQAVDTEVAPVHQVEVESPDMIRPRLGASINGGYTFNEPEGWMLGGSLRLGIQIGDWIAAYYQPTAQYASLVVQGGNTDGAFSLWNSFLFELTPADVISIAAGPSVDVWMGCEDGAQGDGQVNTPVNAGCAGTNPFFGLHGRLAFNIGSDGPGKRHAIQISFEVHPTWFGDDFQTIALLGGLGYDMY